MSGAGANVTTVLCLTCAEEKPPHEFPRKPEDSVCGHPMQICRECSAQWIRVQVTCQRPDDIHCGQCKSILKESDIRALADPVMYQRYLTAQLRVALAMENEFVWCLARGCESGQLHFDGDIFTCIGCSEKFCIECRVPFHFGQTCSDHKTQVAREEEQAQRAERHFRGYTQDEVDEDDPVVQASRKKAEEAASEEAVERYAKRCPGCNAKIQKNGGCDHMTCKLCGDEFCWQCLVDYSKIRADGNHAHKESCPNYRPFGRY